ncbi:MAG: terpene cyclase/mutase family protein [Gracilibacteraceae bacterium]|jgi:hypothetical protein|nr:terpene cyclase/mutase family protein [Gracilibacteraceae bacterium]
MKKNRRLSLYLLPALTLLLLLSACAAPPPLSPADSRESVPAPAAGGGNALAEAELGAEAEVEAEAGESVLTAAGGPESADPGAEAVTEAEVAAAAEVAAEAEAVTEAELAPEAEPAAAEPDPPPARLTEPAVARSALNQAAAYVYGAVPRPQIGSVGGEWAVIGLARAGYAVPESYYETYYQMVADFLRANDGVLHTKKYTEYSRVILALTAAGYDARDAGGYDLTLPLADFDQTVWQGINGPIWALIALDSADYPMPVNQTAARQASRELYIAEILRRQLPDGGFNLTAGANGAIPAGAQADADITGMALQALANYMEKPEVRTAVDKALACLAAMQTDEGGFYHNGEINLESAVQVLVALDALGLSPDDPRFVQNGRTILSNILSFSNGDGSFRHSDSGGGNQMASEQALYALAALERSLGGQNSLYRMSDAAARQGEK